VEHQIAVLIGKTLKEITVSDSDEQIDFITDDDERYRMLHHQDCCEDVLVDDIIGDLDDLIGAPVLEAREASNSGDDVEGFWREMYDDEEFVLQKMAGFPDLPEMNRDESETWTFYIISTIKGSVTIRWYGTSNGYYSERVDFEKV